MMTIAALGKQLEFYRKVEGATGQTGLLVRLVPIGKATFILSLEIAIQAVKIAIS